MYSYQVIATGQAVQKKKDEDNLSIAQYLHGTCMNNLTIAECETAIELLPYLCQYFRFQRYYKYPKFPCVCLSDSCTPVDNTFILYCKRSCRETLNCKACKSFPRLNIHLCIDFFTAKPVMKTLSGLRRCELQTGRDIENDIGMLMAIIIQGTCIISVNILC